jgi:transposase InsO family protein
MPGYDRASGFGIAKTDGFLSELGFEPSHGRVGSGLTMVETKTDR